jgi:hypothetical protein
MNNDFDLSSSFSKLGLLSEEQEYYILKDCLESFETLDDTIDRYERYIESIYFEGDQCDLRDQIFVFLKLTEEAQELDDYLLEMRSYIDESLMEYSH